MTHTNAQSDLNMKERKSFNSNKVFERQTNRTFNSLEINFERMQIQNKDWIDAPGQPIPL